MSNDGGQSSGSEQGEMADALDSLLEKSEAENASLLSKLQAAEKERDELRERLKMMEAVWSGDSADTHARAEKAEASLAASQERVRELEDKAKRVVVRHLAGDGFLLVGAINRLADALSPKPQEGSGG